MPRAPRITPEEFSRLAGGQAKGIYRTNKKGQPIYISYGKLHPLPRGRGSRLLYKRGARLNPRLADIKRAQEKAEKNRGIKKGTGLFEDPLSPNPKVIGVTRIVRKQQLAAQLRKYRATGGRSKLSKKAQARLQKKDGGLRYSRKSASTIFPDRIIVG